MPLHCIPSTVEPKDETSALGKINPGVPVRYVWLLDQTSSHGDPSISPVGAVATSTSLTMVALIPGTR